MAVANRQQRAGHVYGQIQDGAGDQILVVEIAAVPSGRAARDPAATSGGGATPIDPKNGASGSVTPGLNSTRRRPWAPAQQPKPGIREIVRQHAAARD